MQGHRLVLLFAFGVAPAALAVGDAHATPRSHVRFHDAAEQRPSARYGALSAAACIAELGKRGVAFTRVPHAEGVLAPVRLPHGVGGVLFRTDAPDHARATSPFDVFDCRLALALHDFATVLRAHDVDEVRLYSAWRPPARGWPKDKLATRHPGGLAADMRAFGKAGASEKGREAEKGGETERVWLDVERDFHGAIGASTCGADAPAPSPDTPEARELHAIVCEAVDKHLFTVVLTPNYNHEHRNHFHLEVTPSVPWELVR